MGNGSYGRGRGKPFYPRWVMDPMGGGRGKPFYPRWVMDPMGGESLSILGG